MALTTDFIEKTGMAEGLVGELNTFIETVKLDATQENVLQNHILTIDADLRKKYDGKANENAEAILDGAAKKVEELTGIKREKGQKLADFFVSAGTKHVSDREQKLKDRELVLEEKIKNGDISATVKQELTDTKKKLDVLLQKEASIDELIKGDYKTKYETLVKDNESLKEKTAFISAKPVFPKEVNKYEGEAVWKEVETEIKEKYTIAFDAEGQAIAIDKDNQYKIVKLADLVQKNEKIVALLKGRQQEGLGHKPALKNLDGIPFAVPEGKEEIQKAIKEYLLGEKKLATHSPEYAKEFAALNAKIYQLQQQKTA